MAMESAGCRGNELETRELSWRLAVIPLTKPLFFPWAAKMRGGLPSRAAPRLLSRSAIGPRDTLPAGGIVCRPRPLVAGVVWPGALQPHDRIVGLGADESHWGSACRFPLVNRVEERNGRCTWPAAAVLHPGQQEQPH